MASVRGVSGLQASELICAAVVLLREVLIVWLLLSILLAFQVRLGGGLFRFGDVGTG